MHLLVSLAGLPDSARSCLAPRAPSPAAAWEGGDGHTGSQLTLPSATVPVLMSFPSVGTTGTHGKPPEQDTRLVSHISISHGAE